MHKNRQEPDAATRPVFADPSQGARAVKNPPANAGDMRDMGSIPGSGRSPRGGLGNPLQHSCLENPVDRGAWRATVCGAAESHTGLKPLSTHAHMLHTAKPLGPHPLCPPCPLFSVTWASWELRECSGVPLPRSALCLPALGVFLWLVPPLPPIPSHPTFSERLTVMALFPTTPVCPHSPLAPWAPLTL